MTTDMLAASRLTSQSHGPEALVEIIDVEQHPPLARRDDLKLDVTRRCIARARSATCSREHGS
jgi:hypothetical protein